MLFEITKQMGEIELNDYGFNTDKSLVEQLEKDPTLYTKLPGNLEEVLYLKLKKLDNNLLTFDSFTNITAIDKEEDVQKKLMFKKGREVGGDYTYTANFYLRSANIDKKPTENIHAVFMKRFVDTKCFQDHIIKNISDESDKNKITSIRFFFDFIKFVTKGYKNNNLYDYLYNVDLWLYENKKKTILLTNDNINKLSSLSKAKRNTQLEDMFNTNTIYNLFYEKYNVSTMLEEFEGKFTKNTDSKEFREKQRFISLIINDNGKDLYQSDIPIIKKTFIKSFLSALEDDGKHRSKGTCSICLEEDKELYGYGIASLKSPFSQYSVYKDVYISNGANQSHNTDNFPTCIDCLLKIQLGSYSVKSSPFKTNFNNIPMYVLPYSNNKESFEIFYKSMKQAYYDTNGNDTKYKGEITYTNILREMQKNKKVNILGKDIHFENTRLFEIEDNLGLYFMLVEEPNQNTQILKVEKNMSLIKFGAINKIVDSFANHPYFKTYINKGQVVDKDKVFTPYVFLEILKLFSNYNMGDKKFDIKQYVNLVTDVFASNSIKLQRLIRESNHIISRSFKSNDDLFRVLNDFNQMYFALNILKAQQKDMEEFKLKEIYYVSYSSRNGNVRNFEDKLKELMEDANVEHQAEKAFFLLGVLIKKIVKEQQRVNLTGSFIKNMYKPLKSEKDIIKIFNQVSEMINYKYKDSLGYLQKTLDLTAENLSTGRNNYKWNKDLAYYHLNLGFQLENRLVNKNKEENYNE